MLMSTGPRKSLIINIQNMWKRMFEAVLEDVLGGIKKNGSTSECKI